MKGMKINNRSDSEYGRGGSVKLQYGKHFSFQAFKGRRPPKYTELLMAVFGLFATTDPEISVCRGFLER